MRRSTL